MPKLYSAREVLFINKIVFGWEPKETVSSTANRILEWYLK